MASNSELDKWRQEIRDIDAEILRLVSRRMQLSLNIGAYKKAQNLPIKDYRVEKTIIEKARESARNLGLYPNLAEDLMTTLIKYSVLKQDELKREGSSSHLATKQRALVVGGAGHMGQWFVQYYESLGFEVAIFDKHNDSSPLGNRSHPVLEDGLDIYQLIILSTPMLETNEILKKLSRLRPKAMIVEICSLKSPVQEGIKIALEAGLQIASIHPMFGPDTEVLAGKNIIFCTGPGLCSEQVQQQHFQQTSAQLLRLPLDEHDKLMSYILGASHLINLIYAQVLARSGESLKKLREFAGTTFLKQLEVTGRVVAENQALYFDIQSLNQETPYLLTILREALVAFEQVIERNDKVKFRALMAQAQSYFDSSWLD